MVYGDAVQVNRSSAAKGFDPAQEIRWGVGLDPGDPEPGENAADSGAYNSLTGLGMGGARRRKKPVLLLDPEEAQNAYRQLAITAAQDFGDPERLKRAPALAPVSPVVTDAVIAEPEVFHEEEAFTPDDFSGNGADDALARWLPKDFHKPIEPSPPQVWNDEDEEDFAWAAPEPVAEYGEDDDSAEEECLDAEADAALEQWTPAGFGGTPDSVHDAVPPVPEPVVWIEPEAEVEAGPEPKPVLSLEPEWEPPYVAPPATEPVYLKARAADQEWTQRAAVPGVALFPKNQPDARGPSLRARYVKQTEPRPSLLGKLVRWLACRFG